CSREVPCQVPCQRSQAFASRSSLPCRTSTTTVTPAPARRSTIRRPRSHPGKPPRFLDFRRLLRGRSSSWPWFFMLSSQEAGKNLHGLFYPLPLLLKEAQQSDPQSGHEGGAGNSQNPRPDDLASHAPANAARKERQDLYGD